MQAQLNFETASPINQPKFSRQNQIVYDLLSAGKTVNLKMVIDRYGIYHLHSRIAEVRKELKERGQVIFDRTVTIENTTCKEYSLTPFV